MSTKFVVIMTLIIILGVLISWIFALYHHNIMIALYGLLCGFCMMLGLVIFDKDGNKKK